MEIMQTARTPMGNIVFYLMMLWTAMAMAQDTKTTIFDERPVASFAPEWEYVRRLNAKEFLTEENHPALTIIGFADVSSKPQGKSIQCMLRRRVPAIKGDFNLIFDLEWELPSDRRFMGMANVHLINTRNETIASAGLSDGWIKGPARFSAAIGKTILKQRKDAPDIKRKTFRIERIAGTISIFIDDEKILSEQNEAIVSALRFQLGQNLLMDEEGNIQSKFGRFSIHRIALECTQQ